MYNQKIIKESPAGKNYRRGFLLQADRPFSLPG